MSDGTAKHRLPFGRVIQWDCSLEDVEVLQEVSDMIPFGMMRQQGMLDPGINTIQQSMLLGNVNGQQLLLLLLLLLFQAVKHCKFIPLGRHTKQGTLSGESMQEADEDVLQVPLLFMLLLLLKIEEVLPSPSFCLFSRLKLFLSIAADSVQSARGVILSWIVLRCCLPVLAWRKKKLSLLLNRYLYGRTAEVSPAMRWSRMQAGYNKHCRRGWMQFSCVPDQSPSIKVDRLCSKQQLRLSSAYHRWFLLYISNLEITWHPALQYMPACREACLHELWWRVGFHCWGGVSCLSTSILPCCETWYFL